MDSNHRFKVPSKMDPVDLERFLDLDGVPERYDQWVAAMGKRSYTACAATSAEIERRQVRVAEKEIAALYRKIAQIERDTIVSCNDLRIFLSKRRGYRNAADLEEIRILQEQEDQEWRARKADDERKSNERATRRLEKSVEKDVGRALASKHGQEAMVLIMLDSMVQAGVVTASYKAKALSAGYDLVKINTDIAAGKAR